MAAPTATQQARAAAMFKLISHPQRIGIIELLGREGALSVTQIYTALGLKQAVASAHLINLKDRGVLTSVKTGTTISYSLAVPVLTDVVKCLLDIANR